MEQNNLDVNKGIMAWFVLNPIPANLLMVVILVLGFVSLLTIRVEGWPPLPANTISITIPFQGGSPEELEQAVAVRVEKSLNGLAGIKSMYTEVQSDSSITSVTAVDGYSLNLLKEGIKSRIDSISDFPSFAEQPIIEEELDTNHVLSIEVYGDTQYSVLRQNALRIRDELLAIDGIDKITTEGAFSPEISVELKQSAIQQFGITLRETAEAIQQQSINLLGGHIQTNSNRIRVFSETQGYYLEDFANLPIILPKKPNETTPVETGNLLLKDIANVTETYSQQHSFRKFQGKDSIQLNVELLNNGSITTAADLAKAKVSVLNQASWLPANISIDVWHDESASISERLQLMGSNGLIGIILVFIILLLFLDLHIALWVAVGIPVSFAGTMAFMGPELFNLSINQLTTFGFIIALGIVVDDGIIIGESIHSAKTSSPEARNNPIQSTILGAKQVAMPATFGVLTTMAAFFPLTLVVGALGQLFAQIVWVVIIFLCFSLIESKWILPSHLAYRKTNNTSTNIFIKNITEVRRWVNTLLQHFVKNTYQPLAYFVLRHKYNALCGFIAFFLIIVALIPSGVVKSDIFPDIEDDYIQTVIKLENGLSTEDIKKTTIAVEQAMQAMNKDLQTALNLDTRPILYQETLTDGVNRIEVSAQIVSSSARKFSKQDIIQQWRERLASIPSIQSTSFEEQDDDSDIFIAVLGKDFSQLDQAAKDLMQTISSYNGVVDLRSSFEGGELAVEIKLLNSAYPLGFTQKNVTDQIRDALYGFEAQRIQRGSDELAVMVRRSRSERNQIQDLNNFQLEAPNGELVALSSVVQLTSKKALSRILRYKKQRVVIIYGSINDDVASDDLEQKIENAITKNQQRYPNIEFKSAGEEEEEEAVLNSLIKSFLLGLLLIYILLAIPLKSYYKPVVIMAAIPFGIIGAILGHWLLGIPFTLLSFFGVLALNGIVINDSLVLASRFTQIKQKTENSIDAAIQAGSSRFRAIILTSVTTFAGLAPLLLEKSEQAQIIIPMAVSVAFGVLFATIVTLLIIPVLLCISDDIREKYSDKSSETSTSTALTTAPINS